MPLIPKTGVYPVSNLHSSKVRSFSKETRKTFSQGFLTKTPGPGNYRLPSEFGYYESKNKERFLSQSAEKVPEEEPQQQ